MKIKINKKYIFKSSRDTDSFLLELEAKDVYRDQGENSEYFDFSNYLYNAEIFEEMWMSVEQILHLMDKNEKKLG